MLQTDLPRVIDGFSSTYSGLPAHFFARVDPTPVTKPTLIKFNRVLATELRMDLDGVADTALAEIFSGNLLLPGSAPIAMAYAGHQFGHFVPQLGDGRALLLGEVVDRGGVRRDIQLKGSGRTPFSRGGDGRAAIGPVLREYLVSEAMYALGVPATRALAAVATGDVVFRDARVPGAVFTRVSASHVRVGTFQFFAARGDIEATRRLSDYVIMRHYPAAAAAENPYLELLRAVTRRQAALIARWMQMGFIHGVMNTDNMTVSGESIDFGPCAFMDGYDPAAVFSSIDQRGRYAYSNQPAAGQWNLTRFAETLLPLIDPNAERAVELASAVLDDFTREFDAQWLEGMRRKFGLFLEEADDTQLIRGLLDVMHRTEADFTLTFRALCAAAEDPTVLPPQYSAWAAEWTARLQREPQPASERAAFMRRANPAVIPRNHRIEQVITAVVERGDYAPFEKLCEVLARPYEDHPALAAYAAAPLPGERVLETFCGT